MKAQKLYDFREEWEFCSGTDLHSFFETEVGEPSPSGSKEVNSQKAKSFVMNSLKTMKHNSPNLSEHCNNAAKAFELG